MWQKWTGSDGKTKSGMQKASNSPSQKLKNSGNLGKNLKRKYVKAI